MNVSFLQTCVRWFERYRVCHNQCYHMNMDVPRLATADYGLSCCLSRRCHGLPPVTTASHAAFHGLSRLTTACHGLPRLAMLLAIACHGFARLATTCYAGCHGLNVLLYATCRHLPGLPRLTIHYRAGCCGLSWSLPWQSVGRFYDIP